jgi:transcriptional regulator with XRE-family HTH domain
MCENHSRTAKILAMNVRSTRKARRLTQVQLASLANLCPQYINKIESGNSNITTSVLDKLANALNVEAQDLITEYILCAKRDVIGSKPLNKCGPMDNPIE